MDEKSQTELYSTDYLVKNGNNRISAGWKIPTEIWRMIFVETIPSQENLPLQEHLSEAYSPPDFTSLNIAGVCHRWRMIAMSCGQLWCDILIKWGPSWLKDIERIKHYLLLAGALPTCLVVTKQGSKGLPTAQYLLELLGTFNIGARAKRIICLLNPGENNWMSRILKQLPATSDIWILKNSGRDGISYGYIPSKQCKSLKRLLLDAVIINWDEPAKLEEFTISYCGHCDNSRLMAYTIAYINDSKTSLKALAVYVWKETPPDYCGFTGYNTQTLKMSLGVLIRSFLPKCRVPNLRRIEITAASIVEEHEWEAMKSSIKFQSIKEIVCHPMFDHLETLIHYISDFAALSKLEIRGSSVDGMLTCMTDVYNDGCFIFPDLKQLIISSYAGSGQAIAPFIQARHAAQQIYGRSSCVFPEILLDGCTDMSLETHLEVQKVIGTCKEVSNPLQGLFKLSQTLVQAHF